jgi:hypothetical protein
LIERAGCEKRFRSHLACDEHSSDANGYAVQKVRRVISLPIIPNSLSFVRFVIPASILVCSADYSLMRATLHISSRLIPRSGG